MLEIQTFKPALKEAFIALNTGWIKHYFKLEVHDLEAFSDVEALIRDGGEIFFAVLDGKAVGCCALLHHAGGTHCEWELAKMAVSHEAQGQGIGSKLMEALLAEARRRKIGKIYLEGNTKLQASIHLYKKFDFKEVPLEGASYERVDIILEWTNEAV